MKRKRRASVSLKQFWFWTSRDRCGAWFLEMSKVVLSYILNFRVGGDKVEGTAGRRVLCLL